MTIGQGVESWDEYQYTLGYLAGLRMLFEVIGTHINLETGEPAEDE